MHAVRGFGGEDRDVELFAELGVSAQMELAHRLLVPEEAEILDRLAELERVDVVPAGRAVEHQVGIVADPLAQIGAELDIALHRPAPRVELECLEAEVAAHLDVALVLFHRRPGDRRGVRRHHAVVAAQHLVDRHLRVLGFYVPAQDVEHAERAHVDFLHAVDLPDQPPHALGEQRVLPDELVIAALHQVDHARRRG